MSSKEYIAKHRFAPLTARKGQLAAEMIRGLDVNRALEILEFSAKRSAFHLLKVLKSATANASMDENINVNRLYVSKSVADTGPMQMRWRPGPQGRAMPFRKRTCHITVCVRERELEEAATGAKQS